MILIIQLVFQNLSLNQGKIKYTMNKPFDSIFKSAKVLYGVDEEKWTAQLNEILG